MLGPAVSMNSHRYLKAARLFLCVFVPVVGVPLRGIFHLLPFSP